MEELSPDENQKVSEIMGRKWANIVEKKTKLDANNSKIIMHGRIWIQKHRISLFKRPYVFY